MVSLNGEGALSGCSVYVGCRSQCSEIDSIRILEYLKILIKLLLDKMRSGAGPRGSEPRLGCARLGGRGRRGRPAAQLNQLSGQNQPPAHATGHTLSAFPLIKSTFLLSFAVLKIMLARTVSHTEFSKEIVIFIPHFFIATPPMCYAYV